MLSPNLEQAVNCLYDELKADFPDTSAFKLKSLILDKIRAAANDQANLLLQAAQLTEIVKSLSELSRLLP
jgi:hypothetical protein